MSLLSDADVGLGGAPAPSAFTPPSEDEVASYISDAATKRSINPRVALAVAQSEGGMAGKTGDAGTSFGQYQLHYGNGGRGYSQRGLGNDFTEQTGLDAHDPSTWQQQVDFALDHAAQHGWGDWYGARRVGITGMTGIGGQGTQLAQGGPVMTDAAPPAVNAYPRVTQRNGLSDADVGLQGDAETQSGQQGSQQPQQPVRARDLFLRQMIGQGAMAGFGDEAEAAARATAGYWNGEGDWQSLYDKYLANARTMNKRFEASQPGLANEAQLTGAVGGLMVPGPDIIEGATWLGRAGDAALKGGIYGGVSGFGSGEGTANRLAGAGIGGTVGAAAGGGGNLAVEGGTKLVGKLAQPIVSAIAPNAVASGRLGSALTKDAGKGLSDADFAAAQAAGQPVTNMERGGENTLALVRSASNTSPTARQTLEDTINPRFEDQGDRLNTFLANTVNGQDSLAAQDALQTQARAALKPAYDRAYAEGDQPIWTPELERLAGSPDVLAAMKSAAQTGKSRAINEGYGAFNPGVQITDDGRVLFQPGPNGTPTYPNLQYWDYVKRELDDAGNAARRSGRNEEASRIGQQASLLRNELDNAVPSYAGARSTAASFFGAQDALTAGENFVGRKGTIADASKAYGTFSDPEKQLFKVGFVSKLMDAISKAPDRSDLVRKVFGSADARNRMQLALGPSDAKEFEAFMNVEGVMDKSRKALSNSTTARQIAELGAAGGIGGTGYGLLTGDWSPRDLSVAALMSAGGRKAGMKISERVVNRLAEMLTSSDPAVYQQAIASTAKNPTLMKLLRSTVAIPTVESVQATRP